MALELVRHRIDVRVWEARDRVGGGACGVEVGGLTFHLALTACSSTTKNPLAEVAARLRLTTVATDFTDPLVLGPAAASPPPDPDLLERELRTRCGTSKLGCLPGRA